MDNNCLDFEIIFKGLNGKLLLLRNIKNFVISILRTEGYFIAGIGLS